MIFVTHFNSSQAAKDYLSQHLSKGDYFAKDAERLTPTYEGELAKRLGLEGQEVSVQSFGKLIDNVHPETGERLTVRTKEDRRAMTDFTFDAHKSVSLAALRDDRVEKAMDDAVDETMREIEKDVKTRVRKGGKDEDRLTGNLLWARWSHDTTRPLEDGTVDPQQHRHVTVLNMTFDSAENRIKAVQLGDIVRDKGYYQAAYHSRLAGKLKDLGYSPVKEGNSFRLEGIDKELCEKFSRRTSLIEKVAAEKGITDVSKKSKLGKLTRNKKGEELSTAELKAEWLSRMSAEEIASIDAARTLGGKSQGITADQARDYAIEHTFERQSTTSEKRLKAEALSHGVGSVLPDEVHASFARRPDLIVMNKDGQKMATTRATLNAEIAMLKYARDGNGQCAPLGEASEYLKDLSAEQGGAALHVLNSRDRVTGIIGGAGTGKTTTLKAIVEGIEQGGTSIVRVTGVAPSASASRGTLRTEANIKDADTLAMLLSSEKMQENIRGQVLLVDEAGQISTKDMGRLFEVAKKQDARIILSGDYLQHGSVEAGDSFRLLESEAGVKYAKLKTIRRQIPENYRKAVEEISTGTRKGVQKGFDRLDKAGAIIEASGEDRHRMLVNDYLESVNEKKWVGKGKNRHQENVEALIIAPTHAEGDRLTAELRTSLRERGVIGQREHTVMARKSTGWTAAQKGDSRNYEPGMVIEFNQNIAGTRARADGKRETTGGFTKGERAVVTGRKDGRVELIRQDGTAAELPVAGLKRFEVYKPQELKIAKGDRIRITKNGKVPSNLAEKINMGSKRLNNGDIYTVDSFTKDGDMRLSNGTVLPKSYGHLAMGYVDTSYASQGKTVDRVYIAAGSASVLAVNSQQWYVSISRGRESAKVYVDDKREIRDAIARSGQRLSAVELVKPNWKSEAPKEAQKPRSRVHEFMDRNRVGRYLKERATALRDWHQNRQNRGLSYG